MKNMHRGIGIKSVGGHRHEIGKGPTTEKGAEDILVFMVKFLPVYRMMKNVHLHIFVCR